MDNAFLRSVQLAPGARAGDRDLDEYPWNLPMIETLAAGVALDPKVTYLIRENGSGKSTLLEAVAVAAGINAEGGSSNFRFATRDSLMQSFLSARDRFLERLLAD